MFNEGKACDAVIKWIERERGSVRKCVQLPEKERHAAPIEVTCRVAGELYALEHTGIEPFANQIGMGVHSSRLFKPLCEQLSQRLPRDSWFELYVPVGATEGLGSKEVKSIRQRLYDWIATTADTCPIAKPGRLATKILAISLQGVPFPVSLHRNEPLGPEFAGRLDMMFVLQGELEEARYERILRAYNAKKDKLSVWKRQNAKTILVLEENDVQLTDHQTVSEAVARIERDISDRPDDIFLVSTHLENRWWVFPIRLGEERYQLDIRDGRALAIDPEALADITSR